jgi:c(7)-type cytochrome triheme protein
MRYQPFSFLLIALVFIPGIYFSASPAWAEKPLQDIYFGDTKNMPPAWFSHKKHTDTGLQCKKCHDGIFLKKRGSTDVNNALTMKTMRDGKYCGTCHDGIQEFKVGRSCYKCHVKKK